MIQRVFIVALLAGLCAGLAVSIVQMSWSVPLILQAEAYEAGTAAAPTPQHDHAGAPHAHHHSAWEGIERDFWTVVTNVLLGVGGGLLLAGIFALRGGETGWRSGLIWGAGAFAAFALAPAVGLPPELPGTAAAELGARQTWWLSTVVATGAGLAILAFAPAVPVRLAGVALVLAPHIVGAPQPEIHEATAPLALQHEFVAAALVSSACFWTVLGAAAGFLAGRFRLFAPVMAAPERA